MEISSFFLERFIETLLHFHSIFISDFADGSPHEQKESLFFFLVVGEVLQWPFPYQVVLSTDIGFIGQNLPRQKDAVTGHNVAFREDYDVSWHNAL